MRLVITGGAGFIGSSLCARLTADPAMQIRVLDDLSARPELSRDGWLAAPPDAWDSTEPVFVLGDVTDPEIVESAIAGADVIVHLAAQTSVPESLRRPLDDLRVNAGGTLNVLHCARNSTIRRVVVASSAATIGEVTGRMSEDMAARPLSPYGVSKLAAERYAAIYADEGLVETVSLRFSNVYGPRSGHKGSVVANFCRAASRGQALIVHGDGQQIRDFLYIEDLVDGIISAVQVDGISGEIFQLGSGRADSVLDVAEIVLQLSHQRFANLPEICFEPERPGDIRRSQVDISKARAALGYAPKAVLGDAIAATLEDFATE